MPRPVRRVPRPVRVFEDGRVLSVSTGIKALIKHRKKCKRLNYTGDAHELTFTCFNKNPFLLENRVRLKLCETITTAREIHNFELWAYVIMPEHVHLLIYPRGEEYSISKILNTIKQPVSRSFLFQVKKENPELLQLMASNDKNHPYHMWLPGGGYDRNLNTTEALRNSLEYMHNNPVKRGLVQNPEEWEWSSYRAWNGLDGCKLEVDVDSFPIT